MKYLPLIFLLSFVNSSLFANQVLTSRTTQSRISILPSLTYTQLTISTNSENLSGPGLELLIQYALKEKSALGFSFRQMNLGSESSGSALNFRYIYALKGRLIKNETELKVDHQTVLNNIDIVEPTWCVQAIGSQYYLNTSSSTVPFTGFGVGTYYKYPLKKYSNLFGGINYETMENSGTLTSLSLYLGMDFKL